MNKELKELHLVFENCEGITILAEKVEYLYIGDIKNQKRFSHWTKQLSDYRFAGEFLLEFKGEDEFERLNKYKDITQVHISYTDNSEEHFHIEWGKDDGDYENSRQKVYLGAGNTTVEVGIEDE